MTAGASVYADVMSTERLIASKLIALMLRMYRCSVSRLMLAFMNMLHDHHDERCKTLVRGTSSVDQDREKCDLVTK